MEARQRAKLSLTNRSFDLDRSHSSMPAATRHGQAAAASQSEAAARKPAPAGQKTRHTISAQHMRLAGLVAQAKAPNPIPFRTRPSKPSAPRVLRLKARESRSPPGQPNA